MDQFRRAQCQHAAFAAQQLARDLMQVVVKQADRLVARLEVAGAAFHEQPRDVVTLVHICDLSLISSVHRRKADAHFIVDAIQYGHIDAIRSIKLILAILYNQIVGSLSRLGDTAA